MPLERGEEEEGILAPVGPRDPPLLLAEEHHPVGAALLAPRQHRLALLEPPVLRTADADEVAEIDEADLSADGPDPRLPVGIEDRIVGDRLHPLLVVEAVAREALEAVDEQALRRRPIGEVASFPLEDRQRHPHIEPPSLVLGPVHDERLEAGEVVGDAGHRGGERAEELELGDEIVDRHRQFRRGEDFLGDRPERLLSGDSGRHPLGQSVEQVALFDVLLAVEHGKVCCWGRPVVGASYTCGGSRAAFARGSSPTGLAMPEGFSTIEAAVAAFRRGEVIVVVDAEDRENEGDFVCAAEKATPEVVNFMIRHGRGQVCMPILPEMARRLDLPMMVEANSTPLGTAYTVPVDHVSARTGITAGERATTIAAILAPETRPADFVRPGHLFPLVAKEGGVLRRAGHTEAAVDLARMAGLQPAGVLCEILDDTGNRADRQTLQALAGEHRLEIISIEQLIRHRRTREQLVERIAEAELPTTWGRFRIIAYGVKFESQQPIVLVMGDPATATDPLVRLHSSCFTGDLLDSLRCDCGDQLHLALEKIGQEGVGVLVYLPQEGRGIGLVEKIRAYALQDQGLDTVEANLALGYKADARDYGVGIQILKDLGLRRVRLLTNNPKKTDAFIYGGFDLEVVDQVPILPPVHEFNQRYLQTKREKMGHRFPE